MSVLHIAPDSHVVVHAAAAAVLCPHIGAGTVGLLAGAAAFVFRNPPLLKTSLAQSKPKSATSPANTRGS